MEYLYMLLHLAAVCCCLSNVADSFKVSLRPKKSMFPMNQVEQTEESTLFFKDNVPRGERVAGLGERLVLDCDAGGAPAPTIHWLFNGQRIQQGETASVFDDAASYEGSGLLPRPVLGLATTRSRLFIDCFSAADAGEYTCVADTPTHRITTSTVLEIASGEDLRTDCKNKRGPGLAARVYMWTSHRLELQGADVQLFCRVDGNPLPHVTWFDTMGKAIADDRQDFKLLPNGDLLIHGLDFDAHMGLYRCEANNAAGTDVVTTFVYPTDL